jgi:hypothetical protein
MERTARWADLRVEPLKVCFHVSVAVVGEGMEIDAGPPYVPSTVVMMQVHARIDFV